MRNKVPVSFQRFFLSLLRQEYLPHKFPCLPKRWVQLESTLKLPERPIIILLIIEIEGEGQMGKGI